MLALALNNFYFSRRLLSKSKIDLNLLLLFTQKEFILIKNITLELAVAEYQRDFLEEVSPSPSTAANKNAVCDQTLKLNFHKLLEILHCLLKLKRKFLIGIFGAVYVDIKVNENVQYSNSTR